MGGCSLFAYDESGACKFCTSIFGNMQKCLKNDKKITGTENGTKSVFQSVLEDTVQNVYDTQKDVEQKQYLLATGQLEDAHSLPIAQAKAELSLEVMISLRNKAMEAYNEILKMSV